MISRQSKSSGTAANSSSKNLNSKLGVDDEIF